ncbi:NADPH-dependent FMN reductase [Changpingibacter yushuensis]|uniref:NADPH-dependent FMN reductase n=1 Tax=Changpingibacter yushuensis TaxID=2758440 RepID=UPI0015F7147F|nr:NAD(P)H-dependent oxidoreductase [Changpingibacter yushuensis]
MRIGVVIGSVREGRKGVQVGAWIAGLARQSIAGEVEILDLKAFDLPVYHDAVLPSAAHKVYSDPRVTRWSEAVDGCDGFIFVTAEYNHGIPGAFKNAFDLLGPEWLRKPVAFVSYGADSGVRAVEQWRPVVAALQMFGVRAQVSASTFAEFTDGKFTPNDRRKAQAETLLTQLTRAIRAVELLREDDARRTGQ